MADLNLSADVTDLVRARREIRQWSKQTSDAIDIVNSRMKVLGDTSPVALTKFGGAAQTASRGMNRMGMVTQQAGYQVGDFLVQVQSGTNAFVAFGQQATQLVGLMGMFNPALIGVGAALGIAIPLVTAFGAAWLRTRQEQDDAASSAKELKSQIENIDGALQDYMNTARAVARGVSLEEIFSIDEVARAEENLKNVTEQLDRITNVRAGDPTAGLAAIADPLMSLFGRDYATQVETATQAVIDAEERLARVRRMQAGERATEFANRQQELQQEIALQRAILEFGDNSLQVEALRNSQNLEAQVQEIQNKVRLGELTETQGANQERLVRLQAQLTVEQQRANRGLEVYNENLEAQQRLIEERNKAVEAIQQSVQDELTTQQNLLALVEVEATYGKESRQYAELVTEQERETYRLRLMSNGVLGDNLTQIMAAYDAQVLLNSALARPVQGPAVPAGFYKPDSGRGRTTQTIDEIIAKRQEQIRQELELLGLSEERAAVRQIEFELLNSYQGEVTDSIREQVAATAEAMAADEERIRQLEEIRDRNQNIADTIANSFGNALTSVVDGTKSVKEAFKDMARAIIAELYQIFVVKQITGFISNAVMGGLGGGGVKSPKMASGGFMSPNQPYLVGERGPELVMPNRQSTVMNADLTGKALGGGESVNVTQVFNINGNGDEYIMGKIAQAAPRIADATKKSILDERRRGGVYKSVFG